MGGIYGELSLNLRKEEMKDVILIGSGGCMRELAWQIQELNKE